MAAAKNEKEEEDEDEVPSQFECSICMKLLLEPVTVSCGHTFCRMCLQRSLEYRNVCAVCRAPVASGQAVNILVRQLVSERYPRALARRLRELDEELRAGEAEADRNRRNQAAGSHEGQIMPMIRRARPDALIYPHCRGEMEIHSPQEASLVDFALQGGRRLGILGLAAYDDDARPLGVCAEVESVERLSPAQLRLHLKGLFRFWLAEATELHADGFELGRCEPFFDTALDLRDLYMEEQAGPEGAAAAGAAGEPAGADQPMGGEAVGGDPGAAVGGASRRVPTCQVAKEALDLFQQQLVNVGAGGRHLFAAHHGETPVLRSNHAGAVTSTYLEQLSFWLLGALTTKETNQQRWLASVDTHERLEFSRNRLLEAGSRPVLNMPGATSWMNPGQSALSSFALLVAIIALFVAKALGLFDGNRYSSRGMSRSNAAEDFWVFGQLLR